MVLESGCFGASAVIVAAGSSSRMGFDKVLLEVAGKPVLRHSVEAFSGCTAVREIIVVTAGTRLRAVTAALEGLPIKAVVPGGQTRQESVAAGLAHVNEAIVAVHDAARPLVLPDLIARCLVHAQKNGAASAAERLTDTLQREVDGRGVEVVPREGLWRMQTPQVFSTELLRRALDEVVRRGLTITDETSAVLQVGVPAVLVENTDWNPKITVPRDVEIVDFLLRQRSRTLNKL